MARSIESFTLFTASGARNNRNASIRGTTIAISPNLIPLLISVKKLDERIVKATFKGNLKTVVISCYSPYNGIPEENVLEFYTKLSDAVKDVPRHVTSRRRYECPNCPRLLVSWQYEPKRASPDKYSRY